jgi:predicted lipoprotein with Yx(FWY)xxD motif
MTRTRTTILVVTLSVLAGGLTACGNRVQTPSADALKLPVALTRSPEAPPATDGPTDLTGAGAPSKSAPSKSAPRTAPTVAKKQRWVKIFSGPSTTDITPNADKTKGSNTVELNVAENPQIGSFVTDGAGRTLYRFDKDTANPPKSNCNGSCATAWPPLLIKSPGRIFPSGVDPKTVGYVERADHTCQVTINGWPVYYFIADNKPGDVNGQGVNGKWFAIRPDGGKTKAIPGFPLSSTTN